MSFIEAMCYRPESMCINKLEGFTLIELLVVISVMIILSVAVVPRLTQSAMVVDLVARQVLNDIRQAQALSLTSGQRYRWVKISNTAYQLLTESGAVVTLPSGATQYNLTNGVTFGTLTNLPNNLIAFDSQGVPYINSAIPGTALATTAIITLTNGLQSRNVQITPQTGYGVLQ